MQAIVAIDGGKFKTINSRDKNFTNGKVAYCMRRIEESTERYLAVLDATDREEVTIAQSKSLRINDKIAALKEKMQRLKELETKMNAAPDKQVSPTDPDARATVLIGQDDFAKPLTLFLPFFANYFRAAFGVCTNWTQAFKKNDRCQDRPNTGHGLGPSIGCTSEITNRTSVRGIKTAQWSKNARDMRKT